MTDSVDRDFGAPDDRTWSLAGLYDEITRQAVDALERREGDAVPLLRVLVDVAALRGATASHRDADDDRSDAL